MHPIQTPTYLAWITPSGISATPEPGLLPRFFLTAGSLSSHALFSLGSKWLQSTREGRSAMSREPPFTLHCESFLQTSSGFRHFALGLAHGYYYCFPAPFAVLEVKSMCLVSDTLGSENFPE